MSGRVAIRVVLLSCLACVLASCDDLTETALPVTDIPVEQPCDIRRGGCRAVNDFLAVTVVFGAAPRALQPFPVQLRLEGRHRVDSITAAFSMKGMDMGSNRYQLKGESMSAWNANVTLPICVSGRTDWLVDFELLVDGRRFHFQMPFVLDN